MADTEDWITTDDAHDLTGYNKEYLRQLIRNAKIRARKFGRVWQVSRSSLLEYYAEALKMQDNRYRPDNPAE